MLKLFLGFLAGWLLRPWFSVRRRFGKYRVAFNKRRYTLTKARARRLARRKGHGATIGRISRDRARNKRAKKQGDL